MAIIDAAAQAAGSSQIVKGSAKMLLDAFGSQTTDWTIAIVFNFVSFGSLLIALWLFWPSMDSRSLPPLCTIIDGESGSDQSNVEKWEDDLAEYVYVDPAEQKREDVKHPGQTYRSPYVEDEEPEPVTPVSQNFDAHYPPSSLAYTDVAVSQYLSASRRLSIINKFFWITVICTILEFVLSLALTVHWLIFDWDHLKLMTVLYSIGCPYASNHEGLLPAFWLIVSLIIILSLIMAVHMAGVQKDRGHMLRRGWEYDNAIGKWRRGEEVYDPPRCYSSMFEAEVAARVMGSNGVPVTCGLGIACEFCETCRMYGVRRS